jgi:hypothetical protein
MSCCVVIKYPTEESMVFRIRIPRIHMFLGLPDPHPNPLVTSMDPEPDPAPGPSLFS